MKDLAICIPTYNRIDYLIELMQTITTQLDDKNISKIQICVSDNCSEIAIDEPIRNFLSNYDVEYIYHRNEQNIGADRNFLKCVEIATAKYCWLIGDDDGITHGAINTVLNLIANNPDIDVFFGNRYICNRNLKITFKERWTNDKDDFCVDFNDEKDITKYFDQLKSTTSIGYMSTLIVKKEAWDNVTENEYQEYLGTNYIQVAKYLLMLYNKGKLYRIADYITLSRFGSDSFFSSLKQRIYVDYNGFLKISNIFADNPTLADSFLGIVRRHFNNVFLYAMSYTANLESEDIAIIEKIGYTKKQIKICTNQNKAKLFLGFLANIIKMIFTDFRLFYRTTFITAQKVLKSK